MLPWRTIKTRQRFRPILSLKISKQQRAFLLLLGEKAGMREDVSVKHFFGNALG